MAPDFSFGPDGEQWHYDRSSKTYDLTRGTSDGSFTIATTQGPAETFISVDPSITALVIVDMQNFFLSPKCRHHPAGIAAVEPTSKVIEKCRELGIQVIWLNWGLTEMDLDAMPASIMRGFARSVINSEEGGIPRKGLGVDLGDGKGRCLVAGEWNSDIYQPLKEAIRLEDIHCAKNRMSGMWTSEQPLWKHLQAAGKRTLLFTGVNTDQCVLGTLADAYNAGWDCILVEDCCGTTTQYGPDVCLYNISASYGFVVDSQSILSGQTSRREQ